MREQPALKEKELKKEQRLIFLELITMPTKAHFASGLCNICKHSQFWGNCEDAEMECHCGIEKVEESAYDVWTGDDCWAFRPKYEVDLVADMVGLALQGIYPKKL